MLEFLKLLANNADMPHIATLALSSMTLPVEMRTCLQTVDGDSSCALCKEEVQEFVRLFLIPKIQRALRERIAREDGVQETPQYECSDGSLRTLREIVDELGVVLGDVYSGLCQGLWHRHDKNVPIEAYRPNTGMIPFFLSMDNGPAHSFWLGRRAAQKHMQHVGCSLLQLIFMSPHGHDQHQIVEHTIGVVKRRARGRVKEWAKQRPLSDVTPTVACRFMYDAVCEAAAQVSGRSISNGLPRLRNALKQIATPRGVFIELTDRNGVVTVVEGTNGGYASKA